MKILITLFLGTLALSAQADEFKCVRNNGGFQTYNETKKILINPSDRFDELYECREAISRTKNGLICAAYGDGTRVFNNYGRKIGVDNYYWKKHTSCLKAIKSSRAGVVCFPTSRGGNGLWDSKYHHLLGGYERVYRSLNLCTYASTSASLFDNKVCAPHRTTTGIYDRELNGAISSKFYSTVQSCRRALRNY